jgi:hypothetical protein
VFGDSVTNGALSGTPVEADANDLCSNQAIGLAGVYFTYKRYLERSPAPRVVAVVMIPESYGNDLQDAWAGTYFESCFVRPREIVDFIGTTGRYAQGTRMAANRFLTPPSFQSRGAVRAAARRLRSGIAGDMVLPPAPSGRIRGAELDAILAQRSKESVFAMSEVSRLYLGALVHETRANGTRLVLLTGAIPRRVADAWSRSGYFVQYRGELDAVASLGAHVAIDPVDQFADFPDAVVWDRVHLEPAAKRAYGERLSKRLKEILGD